MEGIPRRLLGAGILTSFFTVAFPAFAVTKPTTPCRFVGQKVIFNGRQFTCISIKKNGKKVLGWDSGVGIPTVKPTTAPESTISQIPTSTPKTVVIEKMNIPLGKSSDVPTNGIKIFFAKNRYGNQSGYIITRGLDGILAMSDICAHKGCSVEIQKEGLVCPCHNALFDPKNGDVLRGPASYPLDRVPVMEKDGVIYVLD